MKQLTFIKKWLVDKNIQRLILYFIAWKCLIFLFAYLGVVFLPLRSPHFFGGGLENYLEHPLFWGWANFDGEHYLAIAQNGYKSLEHSFFPLYPLLIRLFGSGSLTHLAWSGLMISNLCFLGNLFLFWKLLRLDYSERVSFFAVTALLVFPTSFYFGAVYTGSLFLFFTLLCFYCFRQSLWLTGGVIGTFASATRIFGVLLLPSLAIEWWQKYRSVKSISPSFMVSLLLIPLGLFAFMWFLYKTTGSPFTFYNELTVFGEQRSSGIVILPQTVWRYIKIFLTLSKYDPLYLTIFFEALLAVFVPATLVWGWIKRLRMSYLSFAILGYIVATLPGSFSSLPRYVLVLFPIFIVLGFYFANRDKRVQLIFLLISVILLAVETALFIRGYWVA